MTAEHLTLLKNAQVGFSPELEAYAVRAGIPYWRLWLTFYGPAEVIDAQWRATQRHFGRIPTRNFKFIDQLKLPLQDANISRYHEPEFGVPSLRAFSIGARTPWNPTPSQGHMWFSPIIPRSGEAIIEANRVFSEAAKTLGMPLFGTFTMPACFWERSFIFILATPVTGDPATNKRYREGFKKLIEVGGQHGWENIEPLRYSRSRSWEFIRSTTMRCSGFHATLKDSIDPNGILSAGRYAIWPKHLRENP